MLQRLTDLSCQVGLSRASVAIVGIITGTSKAPSEEETEDIGGKTKKGKKQEGEGESERREQASVCEDRARSGDGEGARATRRREVRCLSRNEDEV